LDKVLPTGYGVKQHPFFFLMPSYWTGVRVTPIELKSVVPGEPEDVAEMRRALVENKHEYLLRIEDLHKVHKGSNGVPDKVAVQSLALGVNYGECFGFLGPNGAGKSTSISIISGLYPPTSGTARINGLNIRTDIDKVHMITGVCPQDNVLWEDLTAPEHLYFFGRIKNMNGEALKNAVQANLKAVNLHNEDKKTSGQFSGGMKRRLAVACAFMGNPKVVLLDEPSTGLDPASRRQLWDLINERKKHCALLLTTHGMEEADALSDRIAIFVDGSLKCIGSSSELKRRYGKGYKVTLTSDPSRVEDAQK
jgi:ABC-type multidrug transport system ATPase subunit